MTILHPELTTTPSATVMPADPIARYHTIKNFSGLWVVLVSGDHALDGRITHVARPNMGADIPVPIITIDTGHDKIVGPVLAGDILSAALI